MQEPEHRSEKVVAAGQRLGPYEIIRQVGAGGMGVVFEARDIEHHSTVALKTLHRLDPSALLRLKTEFRSVANILHPNLVLLHELHSVEGLWFFSMEYVDGESLASMLWHAAHQAASSGASASMDTATFNSPALARQSVERLVVEPTATLQPAAAPSGSPAAALLTARDSSPLLHVSQVRHIFGQLAQGIGALHAAGKLHRDIKPANVMVARDGRVVLLDFGLVSESSPLQEEHLLAGTPAYMAPERAAMRPATEASDWYSLGIMLYEALAGRRPFAFSAGLMDRVHQEAPALPGTLQIPQDLRELCMALLLRDPAARPKGQQVLRTLLGTATDVSAISEAHALIGRERHLAALHAAWSTVQSGSPITVHVHGRSGMGKTALVQRFLEEAQRHPPNLVLRGRCHEREFVPYKGVDDLVDSLSRYLGGLSLRAGKQLLPTEGLEELVRVFPVLRQVEFLSRQVGLSTDAHDTQEVRRHAFLALKRLLYRLAQQTPLILHIDDLQWGDEDSFSLLRELLSPPEAPPLLLVCSFRSDEAGTAGFMAAHRRMKELLGAGVELREVEVEPLSEQEAARLAAALLKVPGTAGLPEDIARESQGSPFFLEELIRYALNVSPAGDQRPLLQASSITLEHVVLKRVEQLPEGARRLLEVVAVAGRGLSQGLAARAAGLVSDSQGAWTLLRNRSMVRTHGTRQSDSIECYHDRIRETVYASLRPDLLRRHHLRLAEEHEASGAADSEVLAQHYLGAGVNERARHYLTLAADRAASALAFERAAALYRSALECGATDRALLIKRADALVNAGRGAEAAPIYLQAAQDCAAEEAFTLKQRATEQYLFSGCTDAGLAVLRPLLEQAGLHYPSKPWHALLGLVARSYRLRLRGFHFRERPAASVPPERERSMELLWSASKALGAVDIVRGGYFAMVGMHQALELGDPRHICIGLTQLAFMASSQGTPDAMERAAQHIQEAERLARQLEDPYLICLVAIKRGLTFTMGARWPEALRLLSEGARLAGQLPGTAHEFSIAWAGATRCLWWLGDLKEMAVKSAAWLRHAEESRNLYGVAWLRHYLSTVSLASGNIAAAEGMLSETLGELSTQVFTLPHLSTEVFSCDLELYRGDAPATLRRLSTLWRAGRKSYLTRFHMLQVRVLSLRGAAALVLAQQRLSGRKRLLTQVERDAARLQRLGLPHGWGAAALLRGAVASMRGRPEQALNEVQIALSHYEGAGMQLFAASALRRKGELLRGEQGRALIARSEAAMIERGVRHPERWAALQAPGFPSTG